MSEELMGEKRPNRQRQRALSKEELERGLAHRSFWPLALALAMSIVLLGVILLPNPVIFGIGIALVAAAVIGWGLERS